MKTVIQISLFIVAIVLGYFIYAGIQKPIEFEKARNERYEATIQKLKDIRRAQLAYRDVYGRLPAVGIP